MYNISQNKPTKSRKKTRFEFNTMFRGVRTQHVFKPIHSELPNKYILYTLHIHILHTLTLTCIMYT